MTSLNFDNNSLSDKIAEHILNKIISGELQPGEKLVEKSYADLYGTSRAPVREAIFSLTVQGLVERIPRKGAVVKNYTEPEIYDLLEIRILLESLAMKRIFDSGVDKDLLRKMEEILEEMKSEKDLNCYTQLNYAFHMCLIQMSKSDIIQNMYARIELPLQTIQIISFANEGNIEKSISEHLTIVTLLKNDNVLEARDLLNNHNRYVIASIQSRLKKKD